MMSLKLKLYKLHFITPLHLGDVRNDYGNSLKTMASDTMYAALISCLAKLGNPIPENGDLGCSISSLFPFYQKNKDSNAVIFFPKPLNTTLPTSLQAAKERKKIKKVAWLDASYFSKVLNGKQLFDDDTIIDHINGEYLTGFEFEPDFIVSQVTPRVIAPRNEQETATLYYIDRVFFKDYSGLYFIADGDTTLLDKAMQLLQHEGVGTDRNVGNGFFEYEESNVELDIPDSSGHAVSLSLFVPESKKQLQELMASDTIAYNFQRRGGWITTHPNNTLRKNVIYAFTAASVFKIHCNGMEKRGRNGINLKPDIPLADHPVWRCGRALFLPVVISEDLNKKV